MIRAYVLLALFVFKPGLSSASELGDPVSFPSPLPLSVFKDSVNPDLFWFIYKKYEVCEDSKAQKKLLLRFFHHEMIDPFRNTVITPRAQLRFSLCPISDAPLEMRALDQLRVKNANAILLPFPEIPIRILQNGFSAKLSLMSTCVQNRWREISRLFAPSRVGISRVLMRW